MGIVDTHIHLYGEAFDADRFAQKTISLLYDKELLTRFSFAARAQVKKNFSLQSMAKAYFSIYESLLEE